MSLSWNRVGNQFFLRYLFLLECPRSGPLPQSIVVANGSANFDGWLRWLRYRSEYRFVPTPTYRFVGSYLLRPIGSYRGLTIWVDNILLWYVSPHKKVGHYIRQIDDSLERLNHRTPAISDHHPGTGVAVQQDGEQVLVSKRESFCTSIRNHHESFCTTSIPTPWIDLLFVLLLLQPHMHLSSCSSRHFSRRRAWKSSCNIKSRQRGSSRLSLTLSSIVWSEPYPLPAQVSTSLVLNFYFVRVSMSYLIS
jgi:hypothetical protein